MNIVIDQFFSSFFVCLSLLGDLIWDFLSKKPFFYVLQSDDSLEYLSAEEKACLMFLEETIESLDTEEDSGLSNDESDQLPSTGNLATKLADLSASMSKSILDSELISVHRCRIS